MFIGYVVSASGRFLGELYESTTESFAYGGILFFIGLLFLPLVSLAIVLSAAEQFGVYMDIATKYAIFYIFIIAYLLINIFVSKTLIAKSESALSAFFSFFVLFVIETIAATVVFAITFRYNVFELATTKLIWWFKLTYGCDSLFAAALISLATIVVGLIIRLSVNTIIPDGSGFAETAIAGILVIALCVTSVVYLKSTDPDRKAVETVAVNNYATSALERINSFGEHDYDSKEEAIQETINVISKNGETDNETIEEFEQMLKDVRAAEKEYIESGQKEIDDIKNRSELDLTDENNVYEYSDTIYFSLSFDEDDHYVNVYGCEGEGGYAVYRLYEGFNTVSGNVSLTYFHQDYEYDDTYFEIYGDGERLYKSPYITAYCDFDFNVDVSGVDEMKVVFHTDPNVSFYSEKAVIFLINDFIAY